MLRETSRPANEADAAILDTILRRDMGALASIRHLAPPSLIGFLDKLLQDDDDNDANWSQLGDTLAAAGLTASALAAFAQIGASDPDHRAEAYARMAEIKRKLNMPWAAAADQRAANRLRGVKNPDGLLPELEDDDLAVQAAHNDPEAYDRLLAGLTHSPLLDDPLRDPVFAKRLAQDQRPGGPAVDDCSFFVLDGDGRPILQVEADVRGDRYLGCHETSIVLTRLEPSHPRIAKASGLAVRQLRLILEWCGGCDHALMEVTPEERTLPAVRDWLLTDKCRSFPYTAAWIDLSLGEDEIEKAYRTAHRQSLRWGRQNIRIEKTRTPDPAMIELYEQVHFASQRRPGMSKDAVASYLAAGYLNLYIGYFEDEAVVALLSSRHGKTTYYCASAKTLIGNKPIGHVVLHQAIIDAKAEGQTRFDFGPLYQAESFSSKIRGIALYKRGFANRTEEHTVYMCPG